MTDENTRTPDQDSLDESRNPVGGSKTGGSPSPTPSFTGSIGDPARRGFGDKPEDRSTRTDASRVDGRGSRAGDSRTGGVGSGTDAEGTKGRSADASGARPDHRSKGGQGNPGGQQRQESQRSQPSEKSPHGNVPGSTGGDCGPSVPDSGAMPARKPGDSSSTL